MSCRAKGKRLTVYHLGIILTLAFALLHIIVASKETFPILACPDGAALEVAGWLVLRKATG